MVYHIVNLFSKFISDCRDNPFTNSVMSGYNDVFVSSHLLLLAVSFCPKCEGCRVNNSLAHNKRTCGMFCTFLSIYLNWHLPTSYWVSGSVSLFWLFSSELALSPLKSSRSWSFTKENSKKKTSFWTNELNSGCYIFKIIHR